MKVVVLDCPKCGGTYEGVITSRYITCEFCGTRFALGKKKLAALGIKKSDLPAIGEDVPPKTVATGWQERDAANNDPMPEFARMACDEFLKRRYVERGTFKSSPKILRGLGIVGDEVYLIHDDTMLKSGKNGFAITDAGIYCREFAEPETVFTSWEHFAKGEQPEGDSSYLRQDGVAICYYTDDLRTLEEGLVELYTRLYEHARKLL